MNEIYKIINIKYLSSFLAFANTPKYLFKSFINDQSIFNIAKSQDVKAFRNILDELFKKADKSLEDMTVLYALLIACYYKSIAEAKQLLDHDIFKGLKWYKELVSIIEFNRKSDNSIKLDFSLAGTIILKKNENIMTSTQSFTDLNIKK